MPIGVSERDGGRALMSPPSARGSPKRGFLHQGPCKRPHLGEQSGDDLLAPVVDGVPAVATGSSTSLNSAGRDPSAQEGRAGVVAGRAGPGTEGRIAGGGGSPDDVSQGVELADRLLGEVELLERFLHKSSGQ